MREIKRHIIFHLCLVSIVLISSSRISAQCIDQGNYWTESWVSCLESESPNPERGNSHWLLYEFHETQYLDSTHFWNANREGESTWGAKTIILDYQSNEGEWKEIGQYNFPQADESDNYTGFAGPNLQGLEINKLLLTVVETHGDGLCASIAEVHFGVDPEACYGEVDECGICNGPGVLTWFLDADGDGLGDPANMILECDQPTGYVNNNNDLCDNGALGWADIGPLFDDIGCNNCHNETAAGGLDLRTYGSTLLGGNKCGTSLFEEDRFVQSIVTADYAGCGSIIGAPSMNDRASGEFDAEELALLQRWIDGKFPEDCTQFDFGLPVDADGDGYNVDEDCDDENPNINPGTVELVYNGLDDDCNPLTLDDDLDADGFNLADDCDDEDPSINPDAEEIVNNGVDEDCDGEDLISSISETQAFQIELYPNPTKDIIYIVVKENLSFQLEIFSSAGANLGSFKNINELDISHLPQGLYFFEFQNLQQGWQKVEKVVLAK